MTTQTRPPAGLHEPRPGRATPGTPGRPDGDGDPTAPLALPAGGRGGRRAGRVAVLVALAILLTVAGAGVAGVSYLQGRLEAGIERLGDPFAAIPTRPENAPRTAVGDGAAAAGRAPVNILILGSDSRISAGDPSRWTAGAQRTDAIMLAQISGDRRSLTMMSIPRDSWVDVPGHGEAKINAAFSWGGPTLMIQTVEQLTGVRIDHFAVADFESFAVLTDELGGVELTLAQPLDAGGVTLEEGTHVLDGEQALAYARERYNVEGGDFGRVQRQQNWMRAIMRSIFDRELLTDPVRLMSTLEAVTRSLSLDDGLTVSKMRDLAIGARTLRPDSVRFITAPYVGTGRSPDGAQSIVLLDEPRLQEVSDAFAEDRVGEYLEEHPDAAPALGDHVD
ncbi:LytR family transcriptional attenuator [Georgenia soli]|uniref:LytR family transcriptional attenuator n=1 Tax=Georgenia soli TaxID=638953 RepID=A0A2A9EQR3_9MICO|nr:LCP family protein [Georgenia soli]PFG40926.1 LytR family transcriptional attenuator [Georgenia soli]